MKKAIMALVILTTAVAASNPAMAKGHKGRGKPEYFRGPNSALCFPYGETAVAAAMAFSIIYDSIKDNDRYFPVPVPQPVPMPVYQPAYQPQPVYYPPNPPLAYNAPNGWAPGQYYPMQ